MHLAGLWDEVSHCLVQTTPLDNLTSTRTLTPTAVPTDIASRYRLSHKHSLHQLYIYPQTLHRVARSLRDQAKFLQTVRFGVNTARRGLEDGALLSLQASMHPMLTVTPVCPRCPVEPPRIRQHH